MTQEHALSKQTKDELTKLFTKPLTINESETIKLNEDEAKALIFVLDRTVSNYDHPQIGLLLFGDLFRAVHPAARGAKTLAQHYLRDDYRKSITNKVEAQLVCQALHNAAASLHKTLTNFKR